MYHTGRGTMIRLGTAFGWAVFATAAVGLLGSLAAAPSEAERQEGSKELLAELKNYRHKIVYETNRDGNWELYICNADGSRPVNLTHTPDVGELYPKPS